METRNSTDEHDYEPRAVLHFSIRSKALTHQQITESLGVSPTIAWNRGDLRRMKSGTYPAVETVWSLQTEGLLGVPELQRHVEWLLEQIEPCALRLAALRPQCESILLWMTLLPTNYGTAVNCPGSLMARLANLVDEVAIRIDDRNAPADITRTEGQGDIS